MDILNLVKEIIFPLWSIFQKVIFLYVMSTQNTSRTAGQDVHREKDTEEGEVNPFSSFKTRFDLREKDKSS